tara:strand:+ start:421 stop:1893 length:1473 start_codon:yes stop_codon:yes gene_type:complete
MKNKILYLCAITLGIYFIVRLVDQSQMIWSFPLDFANDLSSYMAQLFFLDKCGFHNFCPYWYNGFISFNVSSLGWSLFTLPLYWLSNNILIATFASIILMYIMGFIFLCILGRTQKLSLIQIIAFFFFFFANAIALGTFLRLGRVVSMFAFVLMMGLAVLILYYKNHKLDKKFFLFFIPLYAVILFSHQQEMILSQFLVLGLFLVKKLREKIYIVLSSIVGFLIASFWLVPFILNSSKIGVLENPQGLMSLLFSGPFFLTNIAGIFIPLILLVTFYFYWKTYHKSKKELLFFSPILLLSVLFLFRIIIFIPVLRDISPDPYLIFFLFFIIFYFLKTKFENVKIRHISLAFLFIACITSTVISTIHTPLFVEHGPLEKEVISIFPFVEGRYVMIASENVSSYSKAYHGYTAIYHNLTTAGGWYPFIPPKKYLEDYSSVFSFYGKKDCKGFIEKLRVLNVEEVIFYGYNCNEVNNCGLKEKKLMENVCLYGV